MEILIISDIHANWTALRTVLDAEGSAPKVPRTAPSGRSRSSNTACPAARCTTPPKWPRPEFPP